jgi:hypothetical protein
LTYFSLASGSASQCVPVQASKYYNFGFAFRQEGASVNAVNCSLTQFSGATCSGDSLSDVVSLASGNAPAAGTWSGVSTSFTTLAAAGSIEINCAHLNYSKAWMDHVYLNGSGGYF